MADWWFPLTFAVLSRLCHAHFERLLCVVCALHRFPKLWFDATVPASFLSSLSLLPLAATAGAPVDFMDCFHAYMRLRIGQGTVSDRFFHGIGSQLIRPVLGAAAAAAALLPAAEAVK